MILSISILSQLIMAMRNFSVKVVITVLTQRRFCEFEEEVYALLEYLLNIEGNLFNTQRDQAIQIVAKAIGIQIPELLGINKGDNAESILAKIEELETMYPVGFSLERIDQNSYSLKNPIEAYAGMDDPEGK